MNDRSAKPPAAALPAAALPLLLAACGGHAASAGTQAPGANAGPASPSPVTTQDTTMQANQSIRQGIDALLAADLSDVQALNGLLSTQLQDAPSSNPYFNVRTASSGNLAGIALARIELRTSKDDPAKALLSVDFAQPAGNAEALARDAWPEAQFTPARPTAADSGAYWSAQHDNAKVTIGQPPAGTAVSSLTVDRIR